MTTGGDFRGLHNFAARALIEIGGRLEDVADNYGLSVDDAIDLSEMSYERAFARCCPLTALTWLREMNRLSPTAHFPYPSLG